MQSADNNIEFNVRKIDLISMSFRMWLENIAWQIMIYLSNFSTALNDYLDSSIPLMTIKKVFTLLKLLITY